MADSITSSRKPVPQPPEPQRLSDGALTDFTAWFCRNYPGPDTIIHKPELHASKVFRAAVHSLARWNRLAIEPVPVSERLPGPGDCLGRPWEDTDAGFCWWLFPISEKWCFLPGPIWKGSWQCSPPLGASHWLPHHALPVPGAEVE